MPTHEFFFETAFLMGTDYNRGVKGMGPKKAIAAISKYGNVRRYIADKYDITDPVAEKMLKRYNRLIDLKKNASTF
jgi:5'-3' exonuclease